MLVFLSFLICTASGSCHVVVPAEQPFIGIAACMVAGTEMMPSWEEMHPGWTVAKVRCTLGERPKAEEAL